MTSKESEIIIACKSAIDKHILYNKDRIATIEKEISVGDKTRVRDSLETDRTASTEEYLKVLNSYEFKDALEFYKYYGRKCFETYKECRPLQGKCDFCGEKEFIDQPCIRALGMCVPPHIELNDYVYADAFKQECNGTINKTEKDIYYGRCPKGHGFYSVVSEHKQLPNGIDFQWRTKEWLRWY